MPLAAEIRYVEYRVKRLQIWNGDVAALDRQAVDYTLVLLFCNLHPRSISRWTC